MQKAQEKKASTNSLVFPLIYVLLINYCNEIQLCGRIFWGKMGILNFI
jgi:hypothetical protein